MELKKIKPQIKGFPDRIVLELSLSCNLGCAKCPRRYIHVKDGFMDKGLWQQLVSEISAVSVDTILIPFWRGEATLHPEFKELMEFACERSLRMHISTNGHSLSAETMAALSGAEFVTFSVHTLSGYENAVKFLGLRRKGKPVIQISFIKGEDTAERFLQPVVRSRNLCGFDSVRLYDEHSRDGIFGRADTAKGGNRIFCPRLSDTLVFAYDGSVCRCCYDWTTGVQDYRTLRTIKQAWQCDYLRNVRDNYPDKRCVFCDQWGGRTLGESWQVVDGKIKHTAFSLGI